MHKVLFIGLLTLVLAACEDNNKSFSGYVDADLVFLSSDYGGRLAEIAILRGQSVKKDQFLFRLEQRTEAYTIKMSNFTQTSLLAQRDQIQAQLHFNEVNYRRIAGMQKQNAASQTDLDAALRDLKTSQDQLNDIESKLKSNSVDTANKKWQKSRKQNSAVDSGIVFDTYYTQGEFVQPGAPVLSLITKNHIKAVFFVPESQLEFLRLNGKVLIKTDQNPHFATGHIAYISNIAEYTPPIIYSREERQHLVFRVETRIDTPDLEKIHLGQPVTLELA